MKDVKFYHMNASLVTNFPLMNRLLKKDGEMSNDDSKELFQVFCERIHFSVIIEATAVALRGRVAMICERGVVERIVHQKAVVKLQRSAGCETCKARGSCHAEGNTEMRIEVENPLQAREGDMVEVSMPERSVAKMALVVYFGPAAALIAGAFVGDSLGKSCQLDSPLSAVVGGGFFLAASLIALKGFDRFARSRPDYHPRMTRILQRSA